MDLEELRARYERKARRTNRLLAFLLLLCMIGLTLLLLCMIGLTLLLLCMIGLTLAFYESYQEEQKYVRSRWKTPCRPVTSPATALPFTGAKSPPT